MRIAIHVSEPQSGVRTVNIVGADGVGFATHEMSLVQEGAELKRAMQRFEAAPHSGELEAGDVELVGRCLFDCLLGGDAWNEILDKVRQGGASVLELALSWDSTDHDLHRLGWEAMHDGHHFICARPDIAVAVVRVVADAPEVDVDQCAAPARVLFAIGGDLNDPSIRPGAEIIGLLRGADQNSSPIEWRIVEDVTITRLGEECRRFRPHIVHLVSHGQMLNGKGRIKLVETDPDDDGLTDAKMLADALGGAEGPPPLVLLTGCRSAAGGDHVDPLAAELVRKGLPAVIGMTGDITDGASRLFSRRFGLALITGEGIAEAMAHGRRAGLFDQGEAAGSDRTWTMPSIFLAPCVPPRHVPIDTAVASLTLERVVGYGLRRKPVFCGRREFDRHFEDLLDPDHETKVLVAYAKSGQRLGKTRLLHEFASRALWDGHLVVLIDDHVGDKKVLPSSDLQLAAWLLGAICKARGIFRLEEWFESELLDLLESAVGEPQGLADLDPEPRERKLKEFLGACKSRETSAASCEHGLGPALAADLKKTVEEAAARGTADADGMPVLVLGEIGVWGEATDLLFHRLLGPGGLEDAKIQVPVFATGTTVGDSGQVLQEKVDDATTYPWARFRELKAFDPGEDTLAYQWVLLHPQCSCRYSDVAYAPNRSQVDYANWEPIFSSYFEGIPGSFDEPDFYKFANSLADGAIFIRADDEKILEAYAKDHDVG